MDIVWKGKEKIVETHSPEVLISASHPVVPQIQSKKILMTRTRRTESVMLNSLGGSVPVTVGRKEFEIRVPLIEIMLPGNGVERATAVAAGGRDSSRYRLFA